MTKTQEQFIEKCQKAHGNYYDYSKTIYIAMNADVIILCPKHGEFKQLAFSHSVGQGCQKCKGEKSSERLMMTIEEFLVKANKLYNEKYDYTLVDITKSNQKIIIKCPKHGTFYQRYVAHLQGHGCYQCGRELTALKRSLTLDEFIKRANEAHNNVYDYSKAIYTKSIEKIEILCPKHGSFWQIAGNHLNGHGCIACSSGSSEVAREWLRSLSIHEEKWEKTLFINEKRIRADAFDPDTNTIYEFWGDFWHGNPKKHRSSEINSMTKTSFGFLYNQTQEKIKLIKENDFNLIDIWESDFTR